MGSGLEDAGFELDFSERLRLGNEPAALEFRAVDPESLLK